MSHANVAMLLVEEWSRRGRGNPLDFISQGVAVVVAPSPFFSRPQIALNEAQCLIAVQGVTYQHLMHHG